MSSTNSIVEDESYGSFSEMLFSTSPHVFYDIENIIETIEDSNDSDYKKNIIMRYKIVMKDLVIYHLHIQLNSMTNKYKMYHTMWISLLGNDEVSYINYKNFNLK
jgi:hypothetical protein